MVGPTDTLFVGILLELIQEKLSLAEQVQALELDNWTMRKTLETVRGEALKQEAKERDLIKQLDAAKGEVMSVKVSSSTSIVLQVLTALSTNLHWPSA